MNDAAVEIRNVSAGALWPVIELALTLHYAHLGGCRACGQSSVQWVVRAGAEVCIHARCIPRLVGQEAPESAAGVTAPRARTGAYARRAGR